MKRNFWYPVQWGRGKRHSPDRRSPRDWVGYEVAKRKMMALANRLIEIRHGMPGIDTALLVDLTTETVLSASAIGDQPQEWLEKICRFASYLLQGPLGMRSEALYGDEIQTIAFQKLVSDPALALCVIFSPNAAKEPIPAFLRLQAQHLEVGNLVSEPNE